MVIYHDYNIESADDHDMPCTRHQAGDDVLAGRHPHGYFFAPGVGGVLEAPLGQDERAELVELIMP